MLIRWVDHLVNAKLMANTDKEAGFFLKFAPGCIGDRFESVDLSSRYYPTSTLRIFTPLSKKNSVSLIGNDQG